MANKNVEIKIVDGIVFRRYPESEKRELRVYFSSSPLKRLGGKRIRLHRYVWIKANGPIPEGQLIHHRDENPLNNSIENLELKTASQHSLAHMTEERRERSRRHMLNVCHEAAKKWHGSKAGLKFHGEMGRKTWANRQKREKTCQSCGKQYFTRDMGDKSKYCHLNCRAAELRKRRKLCPLDCRLHKH